MAGRIVAAGLPLVVWARRPEAAAPLAAQGAHVAASIAELGAGSRHVGICVTRDEDVLAVCDELLPALSAGAIVAVHSTILPATSEALDRRCTTLGLRYVDAPVSGGEHVARAGGLTVMCGAEPEAFAAARPVFETFGKLIVRLGGAGAGQRAKLINNALLGANLAAAAAALEAAAALGLDRPALAEIVAHSSGRSYGFELTVNRADPHAFSHGAQILLKDLDLLLASLRDSPGAAALHAAAATYLAAMAGAAADGSPRDQHFRDGSFSRA